MGVWVGRTTVSEEKKGDGLRKHRPLLYKAARNQVNQCGLSPQAIRDKSDALGFKVLLELTRYDRSRV